MAAKVKLFGKFQRMLNKTELKTSADTIENLLEDLIEENEDLEGKLIDDEGNLNQEITILLNGREIESHQGLKTKIKDEDSVMILPLYVGG